MSSPEHLLTRLVRGQLSPEAARREVEALAVAEPSSIEALATRVQSEITAGRLAADAGRAVIETLQRAFPGVAGRPDEAHPARQGIESGTRVRRVAETLEVHKSLHPGSVIKQRFVLETLLGKGGMGVVFGAIDRRKEEARDPNPRVALKVLNAAFAKHPDAFIALQREARRAQTLAHPNVVTVFDFDRDGDLVYMTMELLTGRSLHAMVREAREQGSPREVAWPIMCGIAEGLAYAHRKGIVHSDLKPANVFICADGTPKILDLGIARAIPNAAAEAHDSFDAGSLGAYTEAYATEEMIEGLDPHPVDDMYALGVVGYELLAGVHPFGRHSAAHARKLGMKPPALKGLKGREARALERCLCFDRKRRPQSAGEFLKLTRGPTRLQQTTFAVAAALGVAAVYLAYENYQESSPAIAFSELAPAQQKQFRRLMQEGDEAWRFYERDKIFDALPSAIAFYADAYAVHPRNRDAVAALNRSARALLDAAGDDVEKRRQFAQNLQQRSEHFRKYEPVVSAAQ